MIDERVALAESTVGWLHPGEGEALNEYARTGPFVELGSFAGKSTVWLGDAAERVGTTLFAVDWHRGSPEIEAGRECHKPEAVDPRTGRIDTLGLLRATIEAALLEDVVVPIAGRSEVVGKVWGAPIGFLFIDACHDERVVGDWTIWGRHVTDRVAFHDAPIPAVGRAIDAARGDGFEPIAEVESLVVMERR